MVNPLIPLLNLSVLFIFQAQAEFINDSHSDQETTSKIFKFIYWDQCRPREKQFP